MNGCQLWGPACGGKLEWHHAVTRNRLRRAFPFGAVESPDWPDQPERWMPAIRNELQPVALSLDDILGDTRNRVWLCSHHHELVTNGRLEVALPDSVWEFAREFGLMAQLENDLARRSAA